MKFDPKSHAHIEHMRIIDRGDGLFVAAPFELFEGTPLEKVAFEPFISHAMDSVATEIRNLFEAAPFFYQHMTAQYQTIERLKNDLRGIGVADQNFLFEQLDKMQDSILLVQQCARDGISKVSKQLDKEAK